MRIIPPKRKLAYLDLTLQMPPADADALERDVQRLMATGLSRTGAERRAVGEWAKDHE